MKLRSRKKKKCGIAYPQWRYYNFKPIISIGDLYENCNMHTCVCVEADYLGDYMAGRSLKDGKIYSCSIKYCVPRKLKES